MNKENLTLEQRAKNAVKSNKSQAWKVAVVSALGITVGGGVAAAAILKPDTPIDQKDDEKQAEQEKDVEVVNNNSHVTSHTPRTGHVDKGDDDVSVPEYIVYDQEVVTLPNGSQAEVAWGVTENGNDCVLIDDDMDGRANTFIEDTNNDGLVEKAETIDLADNDIAISMEHLPSLDITVVVPEDNNDLAYVVDDDPNVNIDSDDVVDVDFNPDYNTTDTYDVASNDDIVADPNDNIMA